MTDEQIVNIAADVDTFILQQTKDYQINAIDLSAIINSRLRVLSISEDSEADFDELIDHLNSQTVILPKQIH
ncbi:hypothetical protein EB001_11465 [bacterium]|nr:hypothetical protein [bacterium]